jgi:hypothetical protein
MWNVTKRPGPYYRIIRTQSSQTYCAKNGLTIQERGMCTKEMKHTWVGGEAQLLQ